MLVGCQCPAPEPLSAPDHFSPRSELIAILCPSGDQEGRKLPFIVSFGAVLPSPVRFFALCVWTSIAQIFAVRARPFVDTYASCLPSGDTAPESSIVVSVVSRSRPVPSG